ncbi:MAG: hypothetical protein B1H03_03375 [Planctomycetales bacterium 4484_113]|nr:MAG: hypothetical protein B1H03_03375 [Planctomycetales bacterium 4484_113]
MLVLALAAASIIAAGRLLRSGYMHQAGWEQNEPRVLIVPVGIAGRAGSVPPPELLRDLVGELASSLCLDYEIGESVELPARLLASEREQVEAHRALATLIARYRAQPYFRFLFITEEDLYVRGLNFVFGLAAPGGRAAIVSNARFGEEPAGSRVLENGVPLERLTKVALHEIGHTLLLRHSDDPRSVMKYHNSLAELDASGGGFTQTDIRGILYAYPGLEGRVR